MLVLAGTALCSRFNRSTKEATPTPVIYADSFYFAHAWLDANENGQVDKDDLPLQGATLKTRDAHGLGTGAVTDKNGYAMAWHPGGATYPVTLTMSPPSEGGFVLVVPQVITLTLGERWPATDFLFAQVSTATPAPPGR